MAVRSNTRLKMKQGELESYIQQLDTLETAGLPRDAWIMEQYPTPPDIVAEFLARIQMTEGAIDGKIILDLGCGSGPLSIGCVLLGAKRVIAIDIDPNCVQLTQNNASKLDIPSKLLECRECDVRQLDLTIKEDIDTVIMNPPFGTKYESGIDRIFVEKGLQYANTVYSFHKTSTRKYWIRNCSELNCTTVEPLFTVKFPINKLFKFHKHNTIDVSVDILKFVK